MKRYIYGIPLLLLTAYWFYIEWFMLGSFLAGFLFGFLLALDMVYKKATGKRLDNEGLTDVLERLLP